jgi:DNA polymerase III epsilon subunit-like protein
MIHIFDTETTGLKAPGVVEIAWIVVDKNLNVLDEFRSLVNPEKPIEPGAQAVHGITAEMVEDMPTMDMIAALVEGRMPKAIAHNCLTSDHEILTRDGWKKFSEISEKTVEAVTWNKDGTLQWENCNVFQKIHTGLMYEYDTQYHCGVYTPEHRVVFTKTSKLLKGGKPEWEVKEAKDYAVVPPNSVAIPAAGKLLGVGIGKSEAELRLLEAVRADGSIYTNEAGVVTIRFSLKRPEKINRISQLLGECGVSFTAGPKAGKPDATLVRCLKHDVCDWIADFLGTGKSKAYSSKILLLSQAEREVILDEIRYWDANQTSEGYGKTSVNKKTTVSTAKRDEASWLQTLSVISGRTAKLQKEVSNTRGFSSPTGVLSLVSLRTREYIKTLEKPKVFEVVEQKVFCLNTDSGFFLVRRNGSVWVTGNCPFDKRVVKPWIAVDNAVCTLSLARKLIQGTTNHKLETLQKELGLPKRDSHTALGDVYTVRDLLLFMRENFSLDVELEFQRAVKPVVVHKMPFGKHKGKNLATLPPDYRAWLLAQEIDGNLRFSLNQLKGI